MACRNYEDVYTDPGSPLSRRTQWGTYVLAKVDGQRKLLMEVRACGRAEGWGGSACARAYGRPGGGAGGRCKLIMEVRTLGWGAQCVCVCMWGAGAGVWGQRKLLFEA